MKQIVDQFGHVIAAILILLLGNIISGGYIIAGFLIGCVREQGQHGWKLPSRGSTIDLLFWTIGGIVVELILR